MSRPLRQKAIREGRLIPHPIPCRLVKNADGVWVEVPQYNAG